MISRLRTFAASACAVAVFFSPIGGDGRANRRYVEAYAGCYTDWDGFILAIGADMRSYRQASGKRELSAYAEMADAAYAMHKKAAKWRGRGWVFQPGGYAEHPDFAFAGSTGLSPTTRPLPVRTIAWDSSHFSRWALWLENYEQAEPSAERRKFYRTLSQGLAWQLLQKVIVPPSPAFRTYRITNYMDGRNGYYRWTGKRSESFGPYELSATFVLGWWSFLGNAEITSVYRQVSAAFPLSPAETKLFFGQITRIDNDQAKFLSRLAGMRSGDVITKADNDAWSRYGPLELRRDLWVGDLAQSSYLDLMLPLHAAFRKDAQQWQLDFSNHFSRFRGVERKQTSLFSEVNYLHFASRFMALAARAGRTDLIPLHLPEIVEGRLLDLWRGGLEPVSQTGWGEPQFKGFKPYLEWKHGQACPNR